MTHYDIIKLNASLLTTLVNNNVSVKDVLQLAMFEEFITLKRQGEKHEYIINALADKYGYSKRHILKIVQKMKTSIKL